MINFNELLRLGKDDKSLVAFMKMDVTRTLNQDLTKSLFPKTTMF